MKGREEWLDKAFRCFQAQDYPNRELFVIGDSWDDIDPVWEDWVLRGADLHLSCSVREGLNVGQKRNSGCDTAYGPLIAVWDDDDYSSPGRLSQQVAELQATSKAVTGYREMKFTDGSSWWQFRYPRGLVLGTSLMFTKEYWRKHPFLEVNIGGDENFAADAAAANQLAEVPDLNLMYATIHAGNTSKRKMTDPGWVSLPGFQWREKV